MPISSKSSSQHQRVKIKSEKDFAKLVGKILAEDVVDEENGIVFGKAAEKLTTAMLKRMVDAGVSADQDCRRC